LSASPGKLRKKRFPVLFSFFPGKAVHIFTEIRLLLCRQRNLLPLFLLLFIFPGVCAFYGNSLRCEITENTRLLAAVQSRVPESLTDLFRLKVSALTAGSFLYFF